MTTPPSAIYDIGYRHYEGPRLGRSYVWATLFADSLRGAYGLGRSARAKILPWLLVGLAVVPAVVVALITALGIAPEPPATPARLIINLSLLVLVFVGAQAPQSVSRDLRYRTVSLYFSRPLRRIDYVSSKVAALTVAVFAFSTLPATIVYLGALLAELPVRAQTRDWLLGLVIAAVSAVIYAAVALAIAAWTPRRGIGVAAIVTFLFVTSTIAGVLQQIATGTAATERARFALLLSPSTVIEGLESWLTGTATQTGVVSVDTTLGLGLVGAAFLLVAICYTVLVLRYRKVGIS